MDALQAFCHSKRLTANIEVTKAMVFSQIATYLALTYQGRQVEHVQDVIYLGLSLHQSKGFTYYTYHLLCAARKAHSGLETEVHVTANCRYPFIVFLV